MRALLLGVVLAAMCVGTAQAATVHVDPVRGSDRNPGTSARPLRTVAAAWERIPARRLLRTPMTIRLRPGRYAARTLPNYWESRWGSAQAPITIQGPRTGTATLTAVNLFDLRHVRFRRLRFRDRNDLFHCEACQDVELINSRLEGSRSIQENVKVNQSRRIVIRDNVISGAGDNAIDFVAVTDSRIERNRISGAGDWCVYAKGGSADIVIRSNQVSRCGTGGILAGQGTGLQFMAAPFIRYEAYRVLIADNDVTATQGAAFGVNGAYQTVIAGNRAYDVGGRSHWIEVGYGLRSCDGRPGDDGRERCRALLDAGAWGTTRVDDGDNAVRIPNRHVAILGNAIDQSQRRGDQIVSVAGPFDGPSQSGSGLGPVRADDDLLLAGNRIAGRGLPLGLEDSSARDTANDWQAASGLFADPRVGRRLRLRAPLPVPTVPSWPDDAGDRGHP